jgi:hypothetical protein
MATRHLDAIDFRDVNGFPVLTRGGADLVSIHFSVHHSQISFRKAGEGFADLTCKVIMDT